MTTKSGSDRYPRRDSLVNTGNLGRAMLPAEVFVILKRELDLDDDDLLNAFARGVEILADLPEDANDRQRMGLRSDETDDAIAAASEVTRSRLSAWRKHQRQMTWPELRVLCRGLTDPSSLER